MSIVATVTIKNILFDLGGVLLNINPLLSLEAFAKLGCFSPEALKEKLKGEEIFENYDTGVYSDDDFRKEIRRILAISCDDSIIDQAWNSLLLDFPPERRDLLTEVSKNYNVYLLSNTNSIHYKSYTSSFQKTYGASFSEMFAYEFLSFKLGVHKPEKAIYAKVLEMGRLVASECLFIYDLLPNVQTARAAGMHAFHLAPEIQVTDLFRSGKINTRVVFQ